MFGSTSPVLQSIVYGAPAPPDAVGLPPMVTVAPGHELLSGPALAITAGSTVTYSSCASPRQPVGLTGITE